jgi:hypothetical protein
LIADRQRELAAQGPSPEVGLQIEAPDDLFVAAVPARGLLRRDRKPHHQPCAASGSLDVGHAFVFPQHGFVPAAVPARAAAPAANALQGKHHAVLRPGTRGQFDHAADFAAGPGRERIHLQPRRTEQAPVACGCQDHARSRQRDQHGHGGGDGVDPVRLDPAR